MFLEGDGTPPEEWLISQVCEHFSCTPLEALAQPYTLTMHILEMRSYASTKRQIDDAEKQADMPTGAIASMVVEITEELFRARRR